MGSPKTYQEYLGGCEQFKGLDVTPLSELEWLQVNVINLLSTYAQEHPEATMKDCLDAVCPGYDIEIADVKPVTEE